jgi:hypothetical protein
MKKYTFWIIALLVVVGIPMGYWAWYMNEPGKYDEFASCITDSGTTFYAAFWCPHCQAQKAMFGKSDKYLPYVECSQPSGQGQLQICTDANVTSYPTWQFPDGSRLTGEQDLETLAEKTGCALPA